MEIGILWMDLGMSAIGEGDALDRIGELVAARDLGIDGGEGLGRTREERCRIVVEHEPPDRLGLRPLDEHLGIVAARSA
jgi:hypothetical protein